MAGIGKHTLLVFLLILMFSSRMIHISSAQVEPSKISVTKDQSTGAADDKDKIAVQKKGTQVPHWHIIRGIKASVEKSKVEIAPGMNR
ncbi:hypothetical protein Dsin_023055 [Dipteronia sinensis]|uniref:Uncharacterized protein n=1 Tax=Dipteronia sinensis TaxID=43782 RepID=A0AAE0A382_9ROSI|nr:hypothetical protein Dsin_023055 [Dipteronia sinensis]